MKNKLTALLVMGVIAGLPMHANANSMSFDQQTYSGNIGSQISVTLAYDFTDVDMIAIWFDMYFDVSVLQLVSYSQAPLPQYAVSILSPPGTLVAPGFYEYMGISTDGFFGSLSGAGEIGTFTFEIIGQIDPGLSMTPCAQVICLTSWTGAGGFTFINIDGGDLTEDFLPGGFLGAHVTSVPVPGALWLFVGALGLLSRVRRS